MTTSDLFDSMVQQDPHARYEAVLADKPVRYIEANNLYLVLSHELRLKVLRDTTTFSSVYGTNSEPPPTNTSSPTQGMYRATTCDTELGGVAIPAGVRVVIMFAAAAHDESVFECPNDRLDRSNPSEHLAFGKGTHFCVGANLSRLAGSVAGERLAAQIASVSLAHNNTLGYQPSFAHRGLKKLHLNFTAA